jgi:hypothetical protein
MALFDKLSLWLVQLFSPPGVLRVEFCPGGSRCRHNLSQIGFIQKCHCLEVDLLRKVCRSKAVWVDCTQICCYVGSYRMDCCCGDGCGCLDLVDLVGRAASMSNKGFTAFYKLR